MICFLLVSLWAFNLKIHVCQKSWPSSKMFFKQPTCRLPLFLGGSKAREELERTILLPHPVERHALQAAEGNEQFEELEMESHYVPSCSTYLTGHRFFFEGYNGKTDSFRKGFGEGKTERPKRFGNLEMLNHDEGVCEL